VNSSDTVVYISKNDSNVFGFDLTRILEQNCVQSTNKK